MSAGDSTVGVGPAPRIHRWPATPAAQQVVLATAAEALRRGELVVLPTDTVYGIAAHPALPDAIARVYAVKERPAEKALPLLVASADQAATLVDVTPLAARLMAAFWPGGLTLVLRAREGADTLAVRMPDHPVPRALVTALGASLATTSANRSGQPSCTTASGVLAQLPRGYAVLLDAGPSPGGVDSSVLDLSGEMPRLLRVGAISAVALESIVGPLGLS
jgi:L-threonylcarbamoyladenylate synthase